MKTSECTGHRSGKGGTLRLVDDQHAVGVECGIDAVRGHIVFHRDTDQRETKSVLAHLTAHFLNKCKNVIHTYSITQGSQNVKYAHLIDDMIGRFLWADGRLEILPGYSKTGHKAMVRKFAAYATSYAVGNFNYDDHGPNLDTLTILADRGTPPAAAEISKMIRLELERYGREDRACKRVLAMPFNKILYHTSPTKARDSILRFGIDPTKSEHGRWDESDSGFYAFGDREEAEWYAEHMATEPPRESFDLWVVVPTILDQDKDYSLYPGDTYDGSAVYHPDPAENVKLIGTYTPGMGWSRTAVNTEDTEPTGGEGFLKDPHKNLYPYLFPDGGTVMSEKVRHLLKSHVLNQLEDAFEDPDNFIYFTVYGSGVSYNWDEGGDLDIQMWIDIEKFQALNEEKATWTMDDLLAEVRRNVQLVNFPTVKDIGLTAPNDPEEETTGEMLVQYYPKPGKGTKEENLASKPYACYDLETGEWLEQPKPFDPSFYGLHFLEVMPKATDMAIQAEALLDEFERNVLNWQFWFSLYSRYRNPAYQGQYQEAQRNAILEHAGIKNMFAGIFGGRAEAYSPGGKGIEDERDMLQKVLEVWGIFQRLKHYSRAPLPWDEQELPESPSEDSAESDSDQENRESANDPDDFTVSHRWTIARRAGWVKTATLQGLPRNSVGPHPELRQVAQGYMEQTGMPYNPPQQYATVDPERAKRIADEYDRMEHKPDDPQVKAAYDALIKETKDQYLALVNAGYTFEFYPDTHDPYPNSPHEAIQDVHNNKHLYVFPTMQGFGSNDFDNSYHPLLKDSGIRWNGKPVSYNDLFRAVHDVFGHAKEGVGFRADGEENAWRQHAAMYSPLARQALTSETRGQNSWVNFGPYGEQNQKANQMDTVYADQKAGLLPEWVDRDGDHDHNWRTSSWKLSDHNGWTNYETWWTYTMLDNDQQLQAKSNQLAEAGDETAFKDWTVNAVIGPYNAESIEDAQEWNDVPQHERLDYHLEDMKERHRDNPDALELFNKMFGQGDVNDIEPNIIDPEKVNWYELITHIRNDLEEERRFNQGLPPSWETPIDPDKPGDLTLPTDWTSSWKFADAYAPPSANPSPEHDDPGGWQGIMEKAQRLREEGGVTVSRNGVQNIAGQVVGDNGTYDTEIFRQDPQRNTISLWSCTCPWGGVSWGRTRQWKKYEGRPCAHTLALYWQAQTMPLDEEYGDNQQLQIPGIDPYQDVDLNNAVQQTVRPRQQQPSTLTGPPAGGDAMQQEQLTFPGTFSKWHKQGQLRNGDYARIKQPMIGYDDRGTQYTVPRNSIVEIIWSDEAETIAIYSLPSGPLGPHNARITGDTSNFVWVPRTRGTAPRRHR